MRDTGLLIFLLGSLIGCGSVPGGSGGGVDAAIDTSTPIDAAIDAVVDAPPDAPPAPRCDRTKPFGVPTPLAALNTAGRDIQAMQADEHTLYMVSDRGGTNDLFTATRTGTTGSFATPTVLAPFNTNGSENSPFLTGDRLTIFYSFSAAGNVNSDVYMSQRASVTAAFPAGTVVPLINATEDDGDATVTADGSLLIFTSSRPGTGGYDLYKSARLVNGTYGAPTLVTEINTNVYDAHPRISADGLTIYYSSMRTDGGALAGTDIWKASRTATTMPFGAPTRVAELNTASNESPTWLSPDGCMIYLQSDRAGGSGGQDMWEAVKPL